MVSLKSALRGTIFCALATASLAAHAATVSPVYVFNGVADGGEPTGSLLALPNAAHTGAMLYGVGVQYSLTHGGTLFSLDTATGVLTTLYTFDYNDGSYSPPILVMEGDVPFLYGLSTLTLFKINLNTNVETTLHRFAGGVDGNSSQASLLQVGDRLYGTTPHGGANDAGRLFSLKIGTSVVETLVSFDINTGSYPVGALIRVTLGGVNYLYGNASTGTPTGCGMVYRVSLRTGVMEIVHGFAGNNDGCSPVDALLKVGGRLFGTTQYGGALGEGTVFNLDLASPAHETVLHTFDDTASTDGSYPYAGLARIGNRLYGTANNGGSFGAGTVYAMNLRATKHATIYNFTGGLDGGQLIGGLTRYGDVLYGTSGYGGAAGAGTIYRITPGRLPPP